MEKTEYKHFNLRMDKNMKAYIEEQAKIDGISQNQFINDALELYLCKRFCNSIQNY